MLTCFLVLSLTSSLHPRVTARAKVTLRTGRGAVLLPGPRREEFERPPRCEEREGALPAPEEPGCMPRMEEFEDLPMWTSSPKRSTSLVPWPKRLFRDLRCREVPFDMGVGDPSCKTNMPRVFSMTSSSFIIWRWIDLSMESRRFSNFIIVRWLTESCSFSKPFKNASRLTNCLFDGGVGSTLSSSSSFSGLHIMSKNSFKSSG
mmetsp:Transcript_77065/g.160385  ORF Transcript_77065/g.160385 Transcript_77065/m.160385 type:complete len:204 (-) Transcript_77065:1999-2610(-)